MTGGRRAGAAGKRVVIVGAGAAGLTAAAVLASHDVEVTVVERAATPGGKMRLIQVGGRLIDGGPTVFTMRWVFEELFQSLNADLDAYIKLHSLDVLARHAWDDSGYLDLFADRQRSADAIAAFAGPAEARRYLSFCDRSRRVYETLEKPFMRAPAPSVGGLISGVGASGLVRLGRLGAFTSMWQSLGQIFEDPRLRQLFARYTTYCGSSPFSAPATLMLVAHVEQEGVWSVEGGMHALARGLERLATERGARFLYQQEAVGFDTEDGRITGVELASGDRLEADAVLFNGDVAALGSGAFGAEARAAVPMTPPDKRSLSALTFSLVGRAHGFPLARHNVFFAGDYRSEFADIFQARRVPRTPTVYVCAQDRGQGPPVPDGSSERLFCLVNAPAIADAVPFPEEDIEPCATRLFDRLKSCGLEVEIDPKAIVPTTPTDFHRLFPATGGALYGPASHGWKASFARAGVKRPLRGLYLAGGSVHPGPGVPMASQSGRMAAREMMRDWGLTVR
ncbi:MAG: 1-hydroxycarotenoid 3,4-desaturase CrtD [Geminicoccaceae bacterium]